MQISVLGVLRGLALRMLRRVDICPVALHGGNFAACRSGREAVTQGRAASQPSAQLRYIEACEAWAAPSRGRRA